MYCIAVRQDATRQPSGAGCAAGVASYGGNNLVTGDWPKFDELRPAPTFAGPDRHSLSTAHQDPRIYHQHPDPGKAKICDFYLHSFLGVIIRIYLRPLKTAEFYPDQGLGLSRRREMIRIALICVRSASLENLNNLNFRQF